jgi:hypothetical protein
MIDRIEYADDDIELFPDTEFCHILSKKADVGQFLAREGKHCG